jgi:hypothetical protein
VTLLLVCFTLTRYLVYLRVAPPYPTPNPAVERGIAQRLFTEDNDERAARGLPLVTWDSSLATTASDWSSNHLPSRGEDPPGVQSNVIARGGCPTTAPSPCYALSALPTDGDAHIGWMASPGHRDNILDPAVTTEGVGVFCGPHGILYATEIFGGPPSQTPQPATPPQPVADPGRGGLTCDGQFRP